MLCIKSTELKLLLTERKDCIGIPKRESIELLCSGLSLLIVDAIYGFRLDGKISVVFKSILLFISLYFIVMGIINTLKAFRTNYNSGKLYEEIENLSFPVSKYSLIAIKDTFNEYPKRFLLYYDTRWDCYLFLNYKTPEDSNILIQKISNTLEIAIKNISIDYKVAETHTKYSVSNEKIKTYEHKLYQANITEFTNILKQDEFVIAGKQFKWFSIEEMFSDTNIQNKNAGIVDFVNKNIV